VSGNENFTLTPISGLLENGIGRKAEQGLQVEFPDRCIHGGLAVIGLYLRQDQPGSVAVAAAAHVGVYGQPFACPARYHG